MSLEALTGLGVVAFWVVLLLRLPGVLRQREFRNMYFAVVALGLSVTLYYPPVAQYLAELFGSPRPCNIGMNLWGILTCGAVLILVARELRPRAAKFVYLFSAAVMALIAVLGQTASSHSVGCATNLDLPWWDPYWWVICTMWITATASGVVLCAKCIKIASGIPILAVSMVCFLVGFASSALFWSIIFAYLLFRPTEVLSLLPVVLSIHIWSYVLGLAIGLAWSVNERWKAFGTMRRRMWLLKKLDTFADGDNTGKQGTYRGLWRDFWQNQRLGLYRTEVQILDAVSVIGDGESADGRRVAELAHSPDGLAESGQTDFDKLERIVRAMNEEAKSNGSVQNR
ncbi:hypothetical protein [Mycobacteroides chelonae]|nr:hypothetical protein [Mycobacteroides chelonae]